MIRDEFCSATADWHHDNADIRMIRERVFVVEQRVPAHEEWDDQDELSAHLLARTAKRDAVGTGRLQPDGKITRMAVLEDWRGKGVGEALLEALIVAAVRQGAAIPWLHAQVSAIGFYERFGFATDGNPFDEAGIPHCLMRMTRT